MKIRSNKALKYNPIRPNEEAVIELKIVEVREFAESELFVITVQDSLITDNEGTEQSAVLNIRQKQLTFSEIDGLEAMLSAQTTLTGSYMERRKQLLQAGLLYITVSDAYPIYFSTAQDWEIV